MAHIFAIFTNTITTLLIVNFTPHFQQEKAALVYTISLNLPTKNISSHAEQQQDLQKLSTIRRLSTAPMSMI